jgi:hypothetical protein
MVASMAALLVTQQPTPRFLFIYRDSLKSGIDSSYRVVEDAAAQDCVDLRCPNYYFALESLTGRHEVWWINTFVDEADTARVARVYATNQPIVAAMTRAMKNKQGMIGRSISGFAIYHPELSRSDAWSLDGARFVVAVITKERSRARGWVWQMKDGTSYVLVPARTREQADQAATAPGSIVLAIRPSWSMPDPKWVAADPAFWATAPAPDALLDHLAGTWVMRGTLGGKQIVHDLVGRWVLNHEYLELTEVSREKTPSGAPQYDAILYFVRDTATHEYLLLWLDNTGPSTFAPLGRGAAAGDSIPFLWTMSPTDRIHNTFVYRRATDTWESRIDNEDAKGTKAFGRVTLSRR